MRENHKFHIQHHIPPTPSHELSSDGNLCVTGFTVIIIIVVIIEHSTKHEYRKQTKADRPECDRKTSRWQAIDSSLSWNRVATRPGCPDICGHCQQGPALWCDSELSPLKQTTFLMYCGVDSELSPLKQTMFLMYCGATASCHPWNRPLFWCTVVR